jgi:ferredoxin-like protein FixX
MQRIVATFLLLLAVAANVAAIAQVTTAAPPHACCRRSAPHHCHESASSDQLHIHGTDCCNRNCCRVAAATSQWANPQPLSSAAVALQVDFHAIEAQPTAPATLFAPSQSTRAPPQISIA